MPKALVVCLPPGAGKTRRVWEHILKGASKRAYIWRRRIRETLILTPNRHVHRIWLREMAQIACERGMLELPEGEKPKTVKLQRLKKCLREELSLPRLDTFRRLRSKRCRKCRNLVLDEWHRLPHYAVRKCLEWVEAESAPGWFLGGAHVRDKIYFVSATPVNPVLEDEIRNDKIIDRPYENEDCRLKEALYQATCVVRAFTGIDRTRPQESFFSFLKSAKVGCMAAGSSFHRGLRWRYPSPLNHAPRSTEVPPDRLVEYLRDPLRRESGSFWVEEYAMATGLVRTRRRNRQYFLYPGPKCTSGRSFGIRYERLFVETRSAGRAENWLWKKHPRVACLIEGLVATGMIRQSYNGIYEWTGNGKAVVFCVHQGVALGLAAILRNYISDPNAKGNLPPAVGTNVHSKNQDELVDRFNQKDSGMRVLVATDALSESIDLHHRCKTVIHYELPWSPLRLLQRVGRLTRLKESGSGKLSFNRGVRVAHVIIPGSVEEERINRLVRRIRLLEKQRLWPRAASWKQVTRGLLGSGPSLHLAWLLQQRANVSDRQQTHS